MKLKYNSKEVDRSKSGEFTPPKPGVYTMIVEEARYEKPTADRPDGRIVFVVRQQENDPEGHGKGYGYWDYVNLDTDWKIDQWLQAVGFDTESNPEGSFDVPKDFVGKKIRGRVKADSYDGEYRPKLARALPYEIPDDDDSDEEEYEEEEEEIEAEEEEEEEEEKAEEEEEEEEEDEVPDATPEDVLEWGPLADEGDESAAEQLVDVGHSHDLDENEYETWEAYAEAIASAMKPKPVKKAAAAAKKAAAKPSVGVDYESMSPADLKAELEERGLKTAGTKTALIARLRAHDEDPFSD